MVKPAVVLPASQVSVVWVLWQVEEEKIARLHQGCLRLENENCLDAHLVK